MKLIIKRMDGYYFRSYNHFEKLNDWVKYLDEATLLDQNSGESLVHQLRADGYHVTVIEVNDIEKYNRLIEMQREIREMVRYRRNFSLAIAEPHDVGCAPSHPASLNKECVMSLGKIIISVLEEHENTNLTSEAGREKIKSEIIIRMMKNFEQEIIKADNHLRNFYRNFLGKKVEYDSSNVI